MSAVMNKCGREVEQAAGRGEVGFSGDYYVREVRQS